MTNQQGAPEALADPSPDQLRAIARTARNSSGSASDDCGPLAYVLHGWRAAAIAFRAHQAALVEAQQPAPSAAADPMDWPLPCDVTVGHGTMCKGVSLRTLVTRMKVLYEMATGNNADEVANRTPEQRTALFEAFRVKVGAAPQPSPTPQADSQPAHQWDTGYPPLPRPDACDGASGTVGWSERAMRGFVDADRAARAPAESVTAPAEESRCANCGKSAADSHERIADYPEEGEWFCSAQCKDQHDELDCPHLTHNGYRHPAESERLIACERALRSLAAWLSVGGFNAPTVDAKVFEEKIRWGIEHLLQAAPPAQAADSVLEDAARYRWLRDSTIIDGAINDELYVHVDSSAYPGRWALTGAELDGAVDAARKQGANHD